jgi:hypothetical protein
MRGQTVFGKYVIDREIGQGSMGRVFLARPAAGGDDVVVKTMSGRVAGQAKFRDMFVRETDMMARFRHPNAVRLIEGGVDAAAGPCIVMEYVPGPNLAEALELYKSFDPDRLGRLVIHLCRALHAAHAVGIIHRDLKPANVKLIAAGTPDESVKVMDLGLAALVDKPYIPLEKLRGSDAEFAVGSPAYMCPEQIRGDSIDGRSDLYSLGVMMYELLTGRLPFDYEDLGRLLKAHLSEPAPRLPERLAPPRVDALVRQCLEKFPNERPASAFELARLWDVALGGEGELDPADFAPDGVCDETPAGPPAANDHQRIVHAFDAFMPEAIAVVKLRGFLEDLGARLVASEPGLIRVTLGEAVEQPRGGLFGWFRKPPPAGPAPMAIDLFLAKKPASNRLGVTTVFRALDGPLPDDPLWHDRADRVANDLRGYLMAQR